MHIAHAMRRQMKLAEEKAIERKSFYTVLEFIESDN